MDRMRTWMAAAVLAIGLLGAACGSGGSGGGGAYGGGGGSSDSSGSAGGASVLTLAQANFQFTPANITVNQGDTITVSDTNPSTPHTFTIDGTDIDVSNNAQQSQDVTIDLKPGTYTFYCRFHKAQGMQGTLVVK
jgi:plastocyanin